ncbi:MAG: olefin beta-lactone synthetase OleC [Bacteroidia bacterium]
MNISLHFFSIAENKPHHTAIIDKDGTEISFGALASQVDQAAATLQSKGIQKGDRVLIVVPMGIPLYVAVLAVFRIGAVAVFLDEWVSFDRLNMCCGIAKCKAFIAPWKIRMIGIVSSGLRKIPVWLSPDFITKKTAETVQPDDTDDSETALITFTTGSTGIPKAANRTHGFLHEQFNALKDKIQPRDHEVDMPVLPIVLLLNLGTGVTSIIADYNSRKPEKIRPEKIAHQMKIHQVNRCIASPYVVEKIAGYFHDSRTIPEKPIRFFTGGAPVFPNEAAKMIQSLKNCSIEIVYGSTEAEPISSINAEVLQLTDHRLPEGLPVGVPYSGTKVRIISITENAIAVKGISDLDRITLPHGSIGEIIVSGNHVLKHYINNPEAEQRNKIFIGEEVWHRTGDSGMLNEKGELFLYGRCNGLFRDKQNRLFAPFLWEGWLKTLENITAGTVMLVQDTPTLILESDHVSEKTMNSIREKYAFSSIKVFRKIPRDPRHFSKIEYAALKKMITA